MRGTGYQQIVYFKLCIAARITHKLVVKLFELCIKNVNHQIHTNIHDKAVDSLFTKIFPSSILWHIKPLILTKK